MLLGKAIVKKESVELDLEDRGGDKAGEASQAKGTEQREHCCSRKIWSPV